VQWNFNPILFAGDRGFRPEGKRLPPLSPPALFASVLLAYSGDVDRVFRVMPIT